MCVPEPTRWAGSDFRYSCQNIWDLVFNNCIQIQATHIAMGLNQGAEVTNGIYTQGVFRLASMHILLLKCTNSIH